MGKQEILWLLSPEGVLYDTTVEELEALGAESQLPTPVVDCVFSVASFMRLPFGEVPNIIGGGVLPQATKMLLYGKEKTKKSLVAQYIAGQVAQGLPLWGMETRRSRTLLLQFELSSAAQQARIKKPWSNGYIGSTFNLKLDTKEGGKRFSTIMDTVRPELLILDPVYKVLSGDLNDATSVQMVLDVVDDVAIERHHCAVILVHHTNRSGNMQGSGRLFQWPDSVLKLVKNAENRNTVYFEQMRHVKKQPPNIVLVFDAQTLGFESSGTLVQQVFAILDKGGTKSDLKKAFPNVQANTLAKYWKKYMDER